MFPAGTRVYVVGSAIAGKKLGPKRHSLGYVSNTNMAYIIQPVSNFPIPKQLFVVFPMQIVFTRFGREKKQRHEYKNFLHIMPLFAEDPHEVNDNKIQEIMRVLKGGELSRNSSWCEMARNFINDPNNIGTLIPVANTSVCRLEGKEALAWFLSIIRNSQFRNLLTKHKYLPTLQSAAQDIEVMNWVSNALKGSSPRRDIMNWAEDSKDNMDRLICTIRRVNVAFETRIGNLQKNLQPQEVSHESNSYLTWLMDKMLTDQTLSDSKLIKAKSLGLSKALVNMTLNSKKVRNIYLTLKPKYV
jgi:hypothetical protein